jgi:hypothetical protein
MQMPYESPRELAQSLSDAKRKAIAACARVGILVLSKGVWCGHRDDQPICGITVGDLRRDGIFDVDRRAKLRSTARLTQIGLQIAAMAPSRL